MNIKKRKRILLWELKKLWRFRTLPIFLLCCVLFGVFGACILSPKDEYPAGTKEILPQFVEEYGIQIDEDFRQTFREDYQNKTNHLFQWYEEKFGKTDASIDEIAYELRFSWYRLELTPDECSRIREFLFYYFVSQFLDQEGPYTSPAYLEMMSEQQKTAWGLTGENLKEYEEQLSLLRERLETLTKENSGAWLFFDNSSIQNGVYRLLSVVLVLCLLLFLLTISYGMCAEFSNGTSPFLYSSSIGRRLQIQKALASLIFSFGGALLIGAAAFLTYFIRTDYLLLWNTSLTSAYASGTPMLPSSPMTIGQYFTLSILFSLGLLLFFALFLIFLGVLCRNAVISPLIFAGITAAGLFGADLLPGWKPLAIAHCTPFAMLAQAGSWFSGFIRSGSSPAAGGFIPSLLGQEWITLVVWLLALLILLLLAFRRFCRSTQLP